MYIGEVASQTGLSIKAIRLYEEMGLIAPARQGRYRYYQGADLEVLKLIVQARQLGIKLAELKGAIHYRQGRLDWARVEQLLLQVRNRLEQEQASIQSRLNNLDLCMQSLQSCDQ
ncbi:MerR family transcriptional regulator [Oceanobacter mangrovi]|uniref:MerR family transcriptional regulator n=1 Tax=Oceanobacter mangrovi TaxID=2862510 RepID=UPI001C8D5B52|nr:MerR family transcriptional regulator [Oceanobacter mangrovi]